LAPLYVGYGDIWRAVALLEEVLRTEAWNDARFQGRNEVT
jgi:kynureninase